MPIRAENKARYPANWSTEIRPRILARAAEKNPYKSGPVCEECGVFNGDIGIRVNGEWHSMPWLVPGKIEEYEGSACRVVKIVLTIAHLNHQPEDCGDDNLRAWCQKCHNAYDMPMRRAGIVERARAKLAVGDLFA